MDALTQVQDQALPSDTSQGVGVADQQGGSDMWARIQDAVRRGLISSDQFQQLAAKMGYTPQNVAKTPFETGVKAPDYNSGQNLAGKLGETAGNIAGRLGTAVYNKATGPGGPFDQTTAGAPLDISGGGVNPPSPAWNM